ncbi:MAG TPA: hypothetical protein VHW60_15860 [Caulobacteraceae bacterium]|jgi:hypothetical protein|nr:hypothetical protein [Caulobacteraceae bacterium]
MTRLTTLGVFSMATWLGLAGVGYAGIPAGPAPLLAAGPAGLAVLAVAGLGYVALRIVRSRKL